MFRGTFTLSQIQNCFPRLPDNGLLERLIFPGFNYANVVMIREDNQLANKGEKDLQFPYIIEYPLIPSWYTELAAY